MKNRPLIAIVGVTASGKTDLAIALAKEFNGEIICADSRTVYRGMDIVTAKPSAREQAEVPHHLIDVIEPNETLSAAEFQQLVYVAMDDIWSRGKIPYLVGGSGLYIDSVLFGYEFPPPANPSVRAELESLSDELLLAHLEKLDPEAYERIDRNNRRRVIRAIETSGLPLTKSRELRADTFVLGMDANNEIIQDRIAKRVQKMLNQGLIDEVERMAKQFGWEAEAMTGVGYRAFRGVVEGAKAVDEAVADFVRGDMRLVKKQRTWFRRNKDIHWLDQARDARSLVEQFLQA